MSTHRTFRARWRGALVATLASVAATLAVATPQASADMQCNHEDFKYNACLSTEWKGFGWMDVHVGLDVYLPEQYAREIVSCGAVNLQATLRGDDGKGDNNPVMRRLALKPGWPVLSSSGFAVEFIGPNFQGSDFDEDKGSDRDEMYAHITYTDCHTGLPRPFKTGVITGHWG